MPLLRGLLLSCIAVLASLGSLPAFATVINVPKDQPTIQAGINAAANGDTVLVAPGTYYENIDFKGKAITVTSSAGAAATIIDGGNTLGSPTVSFVNAETRASVISHMTIRNGGAANFQVTSEPSGGVFVYESAPAILNNVITANACNDVVLFAAAALVQGNTISATVGTDAQHCVLFAGPAILIFGYTSNFGPNIVPTVANNTIEGNVQGYYGSAGAIDLWSGDGSVIQGNIIRNNIGSGAGAISSQNTNTVSILQNLIYGNTGGVAGAIDLLPPEDTVGPFIGILAGNTIAGNTVSGTATYPGNTPASQVYLSANLAQYLLVNNIIVGNNTGTTAVNCDVSYNYLTLTPLVFDHNDVYPGQGVAYAGACSDQTGIYGNISADPQFASPSTGNYQLAPTSPAVDSGNNSAPLMPSADFIGNPRIQDSTGKGYPIVDMGAYELAGQQNVAPTILTLTPSWYIEGSTGPPLVLTFTLASAAGTPTGPVTLYEDKTVLGTILVGSSGTATYTPNNLIPGIHAFLATYPGSGSFPPAVSVKFYVTVPLIPTSIALTSTPNPSFVGSSVTFGVTVSADDGSVPSPVTLTDNSTNSVLATLTPNSAGIAAFSISSLALGSHNITATYAGDAIHNSASASVVQQVITGYATTTTLTCSPNPIAILGTAQLLATLTSPSGTPTGAITFTDNGATLGQSNLNNGTASLTYTGQTTGIHTLTATYVPTGSFNGSSGFCSEAVNGLPSTSVLIVHPNSTAAGSPITLSAIVSASTAPGPHTPTGTITFSSGGSPIATVALTNGAAQTTTSTLPAGTAALSCSYSGDTTYSPGACNTVPTVITAAPTSTTLTVYPTSGVQTTPISLTGLVIPTAGTPTPTGAVTFSDGSAPIATVPLDATGHATFASTFSVGTHLLTATYNGSTADLPSTSTTITLVIAARDFTLTASPTISIQTEHHANLPLTLTSIGGFTDTVALSCSNLPADASCTFAKPSPLLAANATLPTTVDIDTDVVLNFKSSLHQPSVRPGNGLVLALILPLTLLVAPSRRRALRRALPVLALCVAAFALTACGDRYPAHTPPGTYAITLTAQGQSTGITRTVPVTLVVTE